jgi:hypothetical protein
LENIDMNCLVNLKNAFSIISMLLFLEIGCSDHGTEQGIPTEDPFRITIRQGVAGRVWLWEGDFMPPARGTISPVVREIDVYTPTRIDSAVLSDRGGFYSSLLTTLVARTTSNDSGFFQVALQTGRYSLFVKEDSLLYAGYADGQGYFQLADVLQDSVTSVRIDIIDQRASF